VPGDVVLLFAAGGLFAAGQRAVDILYRLGYSAAGAMLQVLAFRLVAVRYGVATQLYLALGLSRQVMMISVARFVGLYLLLPLSYHYGGFPAALWAIALNDLVAVPFIYFYDAQLRVIDLRRELIVLPALPAGWLFGYLLEFALSPLIS